MARRPNKLTQPKKGQPKGIGRPPATKEGQKTKTFTVAPNFKVGGFDGVIKYGGDEIELTQGQAKHMMKLKAIELELEDFADEPSTKKPATKSTAGDTKKAASKPKAEGSGDEADGSDAGPPAL